jgi:hypothetical protein
MESPINTNDPPIIDQGAPPKILAACRNCAYCFAIGPPAEDRPTAGQCRNKPPTADSRGNAQWPNVHEGLWCGNHPILQALRESVLDDKLDPNAMIIRGLRPPPPQTQQTPPEEGADKKPEEGAPKDGA